MIKPSSESIKIIVDNDLCISCGTCAHICPNSNISMCYDNYKGKWEASVSNPLLCKRCNGEALCLSVCPSYNVDYVALADSQNNKLLGKILSVYNGYSNDPAIRYSSSSGGIVRELCKSLLNKKLIKGIISITYDDGLDYSPEIITDIDSMPNSIYHNVNFENAISLLKNHPGPLLLIGLPCQITAISLFLNHKKYSHLKEKLYATVSLICGHTFERKSAYAFARLYKMQLQNIEYRIGGRYKRTKMVGKDSKELVVDPRNPLTINERLKNKLLFDHSLPQTACLYCVDHICYCADIVVGDAWQKKFRNDNIGTNLIICRSDRGKEIIFHIGNVYLEEGRLSDIIEAQGPAYALGTGGEGFRKVAKVAYQAQSFIPERKRTNNKEDLISDSFKKSDLFKIRLFKKLLRSGHFTTVFILYYLFNSRFVINHFINNIRKK